VLPNVPGFLNAAFPQAFPGVGGFFRAVYTYAWFVTFALSAAIYLLLMKQKK
jgi:NCS1 family nucleobase:cation symporter-1